MEPRQENQARLESRQRLTKNAGAAIFTPDTEEGGRAAGIDPAKYLAFDNAYLIFKAQDDALLALFRGATLGTASLARQG